jgi:hypothetical protein
MNSKIKQTYLTSQNKKLVRDFILQRFEFESIVGLAGPDINEYLDYLKAKGCKQFEIYENNPQVVIKQLSKIDKSQENVSIVLGDIYQANPDKSKTLFDLDYCASVRYLKHHIAKFKDNFIMTFSTRIGLKETINTFFDARKEEVLDSVDYESPLPHTIYTTNQGSKYLFVKYCDTSAMCCFAKI